MTEYTRNELKILWYLKRHGPLVNGGPYQPGVDESIIRKVGTACDIRVSTMSHLLRKLEDQSLVIRTYKGPKSDFISKGGYNPLVRLELVDPDMWLPELPPPLPLAVVLDKENHDMYERTAEVPTLERTIAALLDRNDELQRQIDKLCAVVKDQAAENDTLKAQVARLSQPARTHLSNGLSQRVQNALTPEQWDSLRHQ